MQITPESMQILLYGKKQLLTAGLRGIGSVLLFQIPLSGAQLAKGILPVIYLSGRFLNRYLLPASGHRAEKCPRGGGGDRAFG